METRCPISYDYYCKHVNVISLVLIILNIHLFAQIFNLKVLGRFLSNSASKVKLINLASFVPKRSLVMHHKLLRLSPTQSRRRLRRIDLSNTNQPTSILQLRTAFCIQWVQLSQLKSEQFQIKSSFKVGEKTCLLSEFLLLESFQILISISASLLSQFLGFGNVFLT